MSLHLLVDEDTQSRKLVELLRQAGHDVLTADGAGLRGQPDARAFAHAKNEGRVLLTQNCYDFRVLHELDADHPGIMAIHHDGDPSKNMTFRVIIEAIANFEASGLDPAGNLVVLNAWASPKTGP